MANVKYGAIVTEIKGKVGGHTFKGTGSGGVLQTKTNRSVNGRSQGKLSKADAGRIIQPLKNTGTNAGRWRSLTESERAEWIAAAPNFPFLNKFGESYTPSGFLLYMSCNNNLLNCGATPLDVPPTPGAIDNCAAFTLSGDGTIGDPLTCTLNVPVSYVMSLYACAAQSAGRAFEAGRAKAIAIFLPADSGAVNIQVAYERIFGTPRVGQVIWFMGRLTKADAGRQGQPYVVQYVVA